eukprot:UN06962
MFHDNSEVEEHEVMLINADPIKKLTPFKNIQITVDLILRNKRDRIAARLRSTLRMDLETMKLLGDLGQSQKISLAKSKPGSDIMNAAGFKNSILFHLLMLSLTLLQVLSM